VHLVNHVVCYVTFLFVDAGLATAKLYEVILW